MVIEAKSLSKKGQHQVFRGFLNSGILKINLEEAGKKEPVFERFRPGKSQDSLIMCSVCKVFIERSGMSKHRLRCFSSSAVDVRLLETPTVELSDEFKENVLGTLRNDSIGIICKKDNAILTVGYWLFQKVKKNDNLISAK